MAFFHKFSSIKNIFFSVSVLIFLFPGRSSGQEKTADTLTLTMTANHRANKAALYSAVIPGAGQIYNKSYWKVPVIYGGFAFLIYLIDFNNTNYKTFKTAYGYRTDLDSTTVDSYPNYTVDDLLVRKDYYRRNRDLCYVITGLVYVLNVLDAYVDAHMKDFDVSDDLSLHTRPYFNLDYRGTPVTGLSLCFKLNR
jgi:hypothetical protein